MTTRIPPTEIDGLFGAVVKRFATRRFGMVPEAMGVLWHNVAVLRTTMGFGQKVERWDRCDQGLKTLAHMAVAAYVGCSWCLDFNYFVAKDKGLDLEKARQVPRWRESDAFSPLERDVLAYAEAMTDTPPTVTDELVARLAERLGDAALLELTAVIGFANLTTRNNVALGIESDGFAAACGLEPLAEPTGVASAS